MPNSADLTISKGDLPNFKQVTDTLFRGGQPSRQGFTALKQLGVRTIINLRDELYLVDRERRLVEELDFQYVSIPLSPFEPAPRHAIERFLEVASSEASSPSFVHCQHGQDRTGMIISIFRMKVLGWGLSEAYEEALAMGFHPHYTHLHDTVLSVARSS